MGINVGAAIGPIVCGLIGDTDRAADFKWAFLASGIGKFASLLMAVWFLANSAANKLAGVLSALYPDNKTTSFLGYQMTNMHEFFMLFVVMSGVAALILLLLTNRLQKMMQMNVQ